MQKRTIRDSFCCAISFGEVTGSSSIKTTKSRRFCLKIRQECPKSRRVAKTLKSLPQNQGGGFLFKSVRCCKSVANRRDGTQWFTVEVGSSSASRSAPTQYVEIIVYKTPPFPLRGFKARRDRKLRQLCAVRRVISFYSLRGILTLAKPN